MWLLLLLLWDMTTNLGVKEVEVIQSLSCVQIFVISCVKLVCPLLSPGVCSDLCPLSQWWNLTTLSSDAPFSLELTLWKRPWWRERARTALTQVVGFPGGSVEKNPSANAGDPGLIPSTGRSPGEGNGNPLQYSCLENSIDRGAWQAMQCMGSQIIGHNLQLNNGNNNKLGCTLPFFQTT